MNFGAGLDGVELDLLNAFFAFGISSTLFEDFGRARFDPCVCGVDIIEEDFLGLMAWRGDSSWTLVAVK